jgi:hypothetical protein
MEEELSTLWTALQTCYEQQMVVILPEVNHDWTMLRLRDYNHVIHKIYARLRFCEKGSFEADKIEKTLQTMLPSDRILQHQYHTKNYQNYSNLIHDLLQVEKHDELILRNHHQHSVGAASLLEVHHNVKGNERGDGSNNHQKKFGKFKKGKHNDKNMKNKAKGQGKGEAFTCHKCGGTLLRNIEPLNTWLNYTKDP